MIRNEKASAPAPPISDPATNRVRDIARLRAICEAEFPFGFVPPDGELEAWLAIGDVDFVELLLRELATTFNKLPIRARQGKEDA